MSAHIHDQLTLLPSVSAEDPVGEEDHLQTAKTQLLSREWLHHTSASNPTNLYLLPFETFSISFYSKSKLLIC